MSMVTVDHDLHDVGHEMGHEAPYETQVRSNRLGLWLFCFSEIFLFAALLVARFVLWGNTRPDLSQILGLLTTSSLLLSSFFMYRSEMAVTFGDYGRFRRSLLIAAGLGTLFLLGVVVLEWNIFGLDVELFGVELTGHLKPTDGVFGGVFFAMTGMHSLHVLSGIVLMLIVWYNGRKGLFTTERHWGVEGTAIYWHYVDVIWIFFYPALYLIGTPI